LNVFRLTEQAWFETADNHRVYVVLEMSNSKLSYYETDERNKLLGQCQIDSYSELQKEDVYDARYSYILKIIGDSGDDGKEEVFLSTSDEALRNHWHSAMYSLIHGKASKEINISASIDENLVEEAVEPEEDLNDETAASPSKSSGTSSPKKKKKNKKKNNNK